MKLRSLFLTIAAGLIVSGIGALDARATSISLPTALDNGLVTTTLSLPGIVIAASNGNTYTNGAGLTFSAFAYTSTGTGTASAYPATAVGVSAFSNPPDTGLLFAAGWSAVSGGVQDMAISYTVTAAPGTFITDASLFLAGSTTGTGVGTIGETLLLSNGHTVSLTASTGSPSDSITFAPVTSIQVLKDIDLNGGTAGSASISIVSQGFSLSSVPEPNSMALLGIGMTGFLAFRRFFKRSSVA